jgi:hypothetical protein
LIFRPKIFLILYPSLESSTTGSVIIFIFHQLMSWQLGNHESEL